MTFFIQREIGLTMATTDVVGVTTTTSVTDDNNSDGDNIDDSVAELRAEVNKIPAGIISRFYKPDRLYHWKMSKYLGYGMNYLLSSYTQRYLLVDKFQFDVCSGRINRVRHYLAVKPELLLSKVEMKVLLNKEQLPIIYLCGTVVMFQLFYPHHKNDFNMAYYFYLHRNFSYLKLATSAEMCECFQQLGVDFKVVYDNCIVLNWIDIDSEFYCSMIRHMDMRKLFHNHYKSLVVHELLSQRNFMAIIELLKFGYNPYRYNNTNYKYLQLGEYNLQIFVRDIISTFRISSATSIDVYIRCQPYKFKSLEKYGRGCLNRGDRSAMTFMMQRSTSAISNSELRSDKYQSEAEATALVLFLDNYLYYYQMTTMLVLGCAISGGQFKVADIYRGDNVRDNIYNIVRYFNILSSLPYELQTILILRTFGSAAERIHSRDYYANEHVMAHIFGTDIIQSEW